MGLTTNPSMEQRPTGPEELAARARSSDFKGQLLQGCLAALGARAGADTVRRVIEVCRGPLGEALRKGHMQPSGWYPAEWITELSRAASEVTGSGVELVRDLAREAVLSDRRGIFRPVLQFASPERILPFAPVVYGLYARGPAQKVLSREPGKVRVLWSGCRGFDEAVRELHVGATLALVEIAGGNDARVEVVPGRPDDELELLVTWR